MPEGRRIFGHHPGRRGLRGRILSLFRCFRPFFALYSKSSGIHHWRDDRTLRSPCPIRLFRSILAVLLLPAFLPHETTSASHPFLENGRAIARGEDTGYLPETPTRVKIDLSGPWEYVVDDGPTGTVRLPAAYDFVGTVTFRRKVPVSAAQLDAYDFHVVMLGANHRTEILINGEFITHHAGGYTSFMVPVPANVLQVGGENVIQVTTDNRLDSRKTLPLRSLVWGWRNYGGVLRDVFLLGTPRLFIRDVQATTAIAPDRARATVGMTARIEGVPPEAAGDDGAGKEPVLGFTVELFDKLTAEPVGKSPVVPLIRRGNGWDAARAEVVVQNPKLWSPDAPELLFVRCQIVATGKDKAVRVIDEHQLTYGLREFAVRDGDFLLNGKRFIMKGVVWQEDHPTWGGAMTYEDLERDIVLIKNLGANTIRFGSHPPHPYMLNLCDRYGLMALQEIPLAHAPAGVLVAEEYPEIAATTLREMILRDRNHPCMAAWGLGNQFESSHPVVRPFVEFLARTARELDDRPLYYVSRPGGTDPSADLVDIAALALPAEEPKQFKSRLQEWRSRHPGRPVLLAQFGSEVQAGNRNGYSDPLSYEAQARFYIQRFDMLRSQDFDGALVWSFSDWRGDRPALTVQSGDPWMHTMGLVSYQREKRLAYEAVRSVFRSEKFVALPIGNFTPSAPIVFVLAGLVVLIAVAYLYNASRRFREALNRSLMNSYNFFADVRDQRVVSVFQSTLLGVIVSAASAIVISSILYHFRGSWVLDNVLSFLLVHDGLKAAAVRLIWSPLQSILSLSGLLFLGLLVVTGLLLALSPLFKTRIYPFHAYAITMWSTPPLIALVPLGMILFRLMESSVYVIPSLILVAALMLWVILRLLKGISIIFDAVPGRVYVVGVLALLALPALAYAYYDYTQSTSTYLSFLYHAAVGAR